MLRTVLKFVVLLRLLQLVSPEPDAVSLEHKQCADVRQLPREERCNAVRRLCPIESRKGTLSIDYLETYYCHVDNKGLTRQLGYWALLAILSVLLFSLLGDTAEKYFSPSLTQICQQVPKMRPRFAGVTILAFANGAPDLSSTINAIKTCKFDLSLGAITGAGMFVNCFVAGWLILVSGGARCRGATIRDVTTYFLTIFGVLIVLLMGRIGIPAVVLAFLLYVAFVAVVFIADEWNDRGRYDFWSAPIHRFSSRFSRPDNQARLLSSQHTGPVWAMYEEPDTTDLASTRKTLTLDPVNENELRHESPPVVWANISPAEYRVAAMEGSSGSDDGFDHPLENVDDDDAPQEPLQMSSESTPRPQTTAIIQFETEENTGPPSQQTGVFRYYPALEPIWKSFLMDDELNFETRLWMTAFLIIRLPFMLLQRASIPLTSPEHYSEIWLTISMSLSPLMILVYFNYNDLPSFAFATALGLIFGFVMYYATKGLSRAPVWSFGTSWPIGASLIALYGLVVGIFWIDILAGELVDLLYCAGTVTGIPEAVLGLTVLAWGNSIGDFFTNTSIAKAGKVNMALTACYAGPLFNMLMGLGLGFVSFFATRDRSTANIHADPQVFLGCICLLLHAMAVVIVGVRKTFRLPPRFGYFSLGVYIFYLVVAVSLVFLVERDISHDAAQCID